MKIKKESTKKRMIFFKKYEETRDFFKMAWMYEKTRDFFTKRMEKYEKTHDFLRTETSEGMA